MKVEISIQEHLIIIVRHTRLEVIRNYQFPCMYQFEQSRPFHTRFLPHGVIGILLYFRAKMACFRMKKISPMYFTPKG